MSMKEFHIYLGDQIKDLATQHRKVKEKVEYAIGGVQGELEKRK